MRSTPMKVTPTEPMPIVPLNNLLLEEEKNAELCRRYYMGENILITKLLNNISFMELSINDWQDVEIDSFKIPPTFTDLSLHIPPIENPKDAKVLIEILKKLPESIAYFSLNIIFGERRAMLSPHVLKQLLAVLPDSIQHLKILWEQINFLKEIKKIKLKWPKKLETLSLINSHALNQDEFVAYCESLICLPSLKSLSLGGKNIEFYPSAGLEIYERFAHLARFLPTSLHSFQLGHGDVKFDEGILKSDFDAQIGKCMLMQCPELKTLKVFGKSRDFQEVYQKIRVQQKEQVIEKLLDSTSLPKILCNDIIYKYCGIFSAPQNPVLKESKKNAILNSSSLLLWGGVTLVASVTVATVILNRKK